MDPQKQEKFDQLYKRGDPSVNDLLHAVLHRLEDLEVYPQVKETNFWRLNKVALVVLAMALEIPYPLPSCEHLHGQAES